MTYTVATMAAAPDPNEFLEIFNAMHDQHWNQQGDQLYESVRQ